MTRDWENCVKTMTHDKWAHWPSSFFSMLLFFVTELSLERHLKLSAVGGSLVVEVLASRVWIHGLKLQNCKINKTGRKGILFIFLKEKCGLKALSKEILVFGVCRWWMEVTTCSFASGYARVLRSLSICFFILHIIHFFFIPKRAVVWLLRCYGFHSKFLYPYFYLRYMSHPFPVADF